MRCINLIGLIFLIGFFSHSFSQIDTKKEFLKSNNLTEEDLKYTKLPRFPGGEEALKHFKDETFKYPKTVNKDNPIGQVIVEFTVEKDGSITKPTIRWGSIPEFDREVLRTILMMPQWEPGEIRGEKQAMRLIQVNNFKIRNADFKVYNLTLPEFVGEVYNNKAENI